MGSAVLIMSDNMSAVACICKQGSIASLPLMDLTQEFLEFCHSQDIVLVPKRLPGWLDLIADVESGLDHVSTEWSLDRNTFLWVLDLAGPFQVDLFATRSNNQKPSL